MNANCDLELDAAFDGIPLIAVGERLRLCVRVANTGPAKANSARLRVFGDAALMLVSTSIWARGTAGGSELSFDAAYLLAGEAREFAIDVYALRTGDSRVLARLECDEAQRECELMCACEGRAEFARDANRLELCADEAEPGERLEGRLTLTNTGTAPALVAARIEGDLELVQLAVEPLFEIGPAERREIAVTGFVPCSSQGGSRLAVRAVACAGETEHEIGAAELPVRRRARFEGEIQPVWAGAAPASGDRMTWRVRLRNAGEAAAASMQIALHVDGAVYLPGSTTISNVPIVDAGGTSPLWCDGLVVEGVAAAQIIELACATIVDYPATSVMLAVRVTCEGRESVFESGRIAVGTRPAAPAFPFVVRGIATAAPATEEGGSRHWRSGRAALEPRVVCYLQAATGFVRHLWAISILCADRSEERSDAELETLRVTLRSVFDRLAIKLRMPQYRLDADDVLDRPARGALASLGSHGDGTLGSLLAAASTFVADEGDRAQPERAELAAYRDALRSHLSTFRDDAVLLDALPVPQRALDERLDALLARWTGRLSA